MSETKKEEEDLYFVDPKSDKEGREPVQIRLHTQVLSNVNMIF